MGNSKKIVVKICGITNAADAKLAVKLGADMLGFIFAGSPRRISPAKAVKIAKKLPKEVKKTGVFVNEDYREINKLIKKIKLDYVQLCGCEKPSEIRKIRGARRIRAIRVKNRKDLIEQVKAYKGCVNFFLFDSYKKGKYGGTGKTFNLSFLKGLRLNKAYFVAGGITPANVKKIINKVRPYGIDAASGVESAPGKKSPLKLERLFKEIRNIK